MGVAGALKTQTIVEECLSDSARRVLVTTFTNENLNQLRARIGAAAGGLIPKNIQLVSWVSFLLNDGARPYQSHVLGRPSVIAGLNFGLDRKKLRIPKAKPRQYYVDRAGGVYRDFLADLVCEINQASGGKVIARLQQMYDHIYVDEVQDLGGYDLDVLDLLFDSTIDITLVGDPRQCLIQTNLSSKNKKYRGVGISRWLDERDSRCQRIDRTTSARCNQQICDFASKIFPQLPSLSGHGEVTGHDGIFEITSDGLSAYIAQWRPQMLRDSKASKTFGYPAMNFGVAKGSTYDRVLIFTTRPMREYLRDGDATKLKAPERLYVAVTRAKYSVAFVVG